MSGLFLFARPDSRNRLSRKSRCFLLSGIACALLILLFVGTAAKAGRNIGLGSAYKGWKVASLDIEGFGGAQSNELKAGLVLSGKSGILGRKHATFYPQHLENDLSRSRLFLAERGYPRARVGFRIDPKPKKEEVRLTLEVVPGEPVIVESIRIDGIHDASAPLPIRERMIFTDPILRQSVDELEHRLRDSGHARAHVKASLDPIDSTRVAVRFHAIPGPICFFGEKVVEGPSPDLLPLVRRSAEIDAGERFSPAKIAIAEENLRLLGLFRRVRVATIDDGRDTLNVHLELIPRLPQFVEAGIGYWTDDQLRAQVRWGHRNLFRAGRGMEAHASYSQFLREVGIGFQWLGLAGSRTSGILNGRLRQEDEESYELRGQEIQFAGRYRHSFRTSVTGAVSFSNIAIDLKTEEAGVVDGEGLLTTLSLAWLRDGSNDRLYPTRGTVGRFTAEWGPPGRLTESHFLRGETSHSVYASVGGLAVIAARAGLGLAAPTGDSADLLPNKRFYAGGMTSMRGFSRRKLGPLDADGAPLGGEAKIELGTELRFPILWRFKGAIFIDSGQVWSNRKELRADQMEVAAGPSLMVQTPIGPVRADLGIRLTDREKDQPMQAFHVSIGHPF